MGRGDYARQSTFCEGSVGGKDLKECLYGLSSQRGRMALHHHVGLFGLIRRSGQWRMKLFGFLKDLPSTVWGVEVAGRRQEQ